MDNIAMRTAKQLPAVARQVMQNLLGRRLKDDEQVTVMVFPPHPAPPKAVRRAAISRMEKVLDRAAQNLKDVPADEFNAAVDEATQRVRRWK